MSSIVAHKIRIFPTQEQEQYLLKACGVARFAYNWAIAENKKYYDETGKFLFFNALSKYLNSIKKDQFPWMYEVTKSAAEQALKNYEKALKKFIKYIKIPKEVRKKTRKVGFPQYKKKSSGDNYSFYVCNTQDRVEDKLFYLPRMKTPIEMAESLMFKGKILSYTVSRDVNRWYVSICVELQEGIQEERKENLGEVGIDLGIKTLITTSDGKTVENPKLYRKHKNQLRRLQRSFSRKVKGSMNRAKAKTKLAIVHRKIRLARKNLIEHTTKDLASSYNKIVIEDLKVSNMVKNHKLASAILDCGFYMFKTRLTSKCVKYKTDLVIADTFFPSSKLCSNHGCSYKNTGLKLRQRTFHCPSCGTSIDRDLNASLNLLRIEEKTKFLGVSPEKPLYRLAVGNEVLIGDENRKACGEGISRKEKSFCSLRRNKKDNLLTTVNE